MRSIGADPHRKAKGSVFAAKAVEHTRAKAVLLPQRSCSARTSGARKTGRGLQWPRRGWRMLACGLRAGGGAVSCRCRHCGCSPPCTRSVCRCPFYFCSCAGVVQGWGESLPSKGNQSKQSNQKKQKQQKKKDEDDDEKKKKMRPHRTAEPSPRLAARRRTGPPQARPRGRAETPALRSAAGTAGANAVKTGSQRLRRRFARANGGAVTSQPDGLQQFRPQRRRETLPRCELYAMTAAVSCKQ